MNKGIYEIPFLYPLKTSENKKFSDVFMVFRKKRTVYFLIQYILGRRFHKGSSPNFASNIKQID